MHKGAGKIWYAIPPHERTKFEKVAKQKRAELLKEDPNFLLNINSMINPGYLAENGVTVYSTWQKPGEFILTFPASYHAGFSPGFNVGEAVNFSAPSWMDYTEKAMRIYLATKEKVPVFPVQWLAIENARLWESSKFTPSVAKKLYEFMSKFIKEELAYRKFIGKLYGPNIKPKEYKASIFNEFR